MPRSRPAWPEIAATCRLWRVIPSLRSSEDARLNNVYQAWTEVLKHPKPDEAKNDAEILKRLVAAERAWIVFRDTDCNLQSTSMLGGTGESNAYGDCVYAMTKARV